MRSYDDQRAFMEQLLELWVKYPELRFAAFIGNACTDNFFDSDKEVLIRMKRFYSEDKAHKDQFDDVREGHERQ